MQIAQVRIAGYKSLYDVTLEPGQLTVLAGPNNAGKSNLVEALDFLTDVHTNGVELAISRKGGFENVAFRRMRRTRRPVLFEVQAHLSSSEVIGRGSRRRAVGPSIDLSHSFSLEATSRTRDTDFKVSVERLHAESPDLSTKRARIFEIDRSANELRVRVGQSRRLRDSQLSELVAPFGVAGFRDFLSRQTGPAELVVEAAQFNAVANTFSSEMSRNRVFQLSPLECRKSGVPVPNPQLGRHGDNLPAVVRYLRSLGRRPWESILEGLKEVVPKLRDVDLEFTQDRRLSLRFIEEGTGRPWSAQEVSDGTIQALAMLCVLYDPRSALVVIEEPENSVHPWIIRVLLEQIKRASKQILITTHSPVLLGHVRPHDVRVVWKDEGRTQVEPLLHLEPDADSMWEGGQLNVFDIIDSGWLREAIPPSP